MHAEPSAALYGRRVMLRPLVLSDFAAWRDVRETSADWLTRWEPQRLPGQPDTTRDRVPPNMHAHEVGHRPEVPDGEWEEALRGSPLASGISGGLAQEVPAALWGWLPNEQSACRCPAATWLEKGECTFFIRSARCGFGFTL